MLLEANRQRLLRAMGLVPAVLAGGLAGCEVEADPVDAADFADQLATAETGVSQAPPPGVLTLNFQGPLLAGVWLNAQVTGADPGANVFLLASGTTGAGPCPAALNGVCVDLVAPKIVGTATANANGQAIVPFIMPHRVPEGAISYFQAAGTSPGAGDTSGVASAPVDYPPRDCGDLPWLRPSTVYTDYNFFACAAIPASGICPSYTQIGGQGANTLFTLNSGLPVNGGGGGWSVYLWCDETSVEDACCYGMEIGQWAIGRPFRVHGQARTAEGACTAGWAEGLPVDLRGLSRRERRRLTAAWTRSAQGEHASVAAFARFVLQLLQLGAPAELVADATAAMQDEIRHARVAFGIASAFAGELVGAGSLDTADALAATDLTAIVLDTVREGCVAETIAAAQAEVARDACVDPVIRDALSAIVADEQRHAELAWRFVRWALQVHPELAPAVAAAFSEGLEQPLVAVDPMAEVLRAHGQLCEAEMQAVAQRVHAEVVMPCARALLADQPVGVGLAA
jgi:hypothetical protein